MKTLTAPRIRRPDDRLSLPETSRSDRSSPPRRQATPRRWRDLALRDSRGIALPTAMIALVLLTTLLIAFAVLSKNEPTIAANQVRSAQARALAEAGIERALWALTSATLSSGIPDPMTSSIATAPYDGSTFMALGTLGGFTLTVTSAGVANERAIDAVGWVPTVTTAPGAAHRRIHFAISKINSLNPPAALSVRGELRIQGSVLIDSRSDSSCGAKAGTYTTDDTNRGGSADVYGYGNNTKNELAGSPADIMSYVPTSQFDQNIFKDADLDMLKALAKCCGTYIGPGSPSGWGSSPSVAFNASNPFPKNGLIFVDTRTGVNPTNSTPDGDFAQVSITGNAAPPGETEFRGWLVVNGRIDWQGNTKARGLVYAQNDLSWSGTETIHGAVLSRNIKDTSSTNIDSDLGGTATIIYNCAATKPPGTLPQGWFLKTGTYREVSD